jgi:Domain of unknown function (DUF1707)
MATDPKLIRASDTDRDRTANVLREHHAVGRLDADEFNERLDKVFSAKTMGELEALTADLPAVDPYPLPTSSLPRHYAAGGSGLPASSVLGAMSRGHGRFSPAWQAAWGSWFGTALLLSVIWLLTGAGYPWPLWVIGPWGAIMAGRWIVGSHPEGPRGKGHIGGSSSRLDHGQLDHGQLDRGQAGRGGDDAGGPRGNG